MPPCRPQTMKVINELSRKSTANHKSNWRAPRQLGICERALNEWARRHRPFESFEGNTSPIYSQAERESSRNTNRRRQLNIPAISRTRSADHPWRFNPISILYNTTLVKKDKRPRAFRICCWAKWKGKITIPIRRRHDHGAISRRF